MTKQYRLTWFNRYRENPQKKHGEWETDRQVVVEQMKTERVKYPANVYSIE
jgi:hypothetical protein